MTLIPTVALEADRYGIPNRAAAAISTAVLTDYGIVTSDNKMNIIDTTKFGEQGKLQEEILRKESLLTTCILLLCFLREEKI